MRFRVASIGTLAIASALTLFGGEASGPSTLEERERALRIVRSLEADPLSKGAKNDRAWLTFWLADVPDITVSLCTEFFPALLESKKRYAPELVMQSVFSMAAHAIEHPERSQNDLSKYQAGVEGTLKAYSAILKHKPEARWPILDQLIMKRDKGELSEFIATTAPRCETK